MYELFVGVWITHIVTGPVSLHRTPYQDGITLIVRIRCPDIFGVTMWVIRTVGADLSRPSPIYRPLHPSLHCLPTTNSYICGFRYIEARSMFMKGAEEVGFEPTKAFTLHDFQSCSLDHYETPP